MKLMVLLVKSIGGRAWCWDSEMIWQWQVSNYLTWGTRSLAFGLTARYLGHRHQLSVISKDQQWSLVPISLWWPLGSTALFWPGQRPCYFSSSYRSQICGKFWRSKILFTVFAPGTDFLLKKWIYFILVKSHGYSILLPPNLDVHGFSVV